MRAREESRRPDAVPVGGSLPMVLCCVVGPAVMGAVAGGEIGGWLGIACAVTLAAVIALIVHRRTRSRGAC